MLCTHTAMRLTMTAQGQHQEQLKASWVGFLLTMLAYFSHFVITPCKNAVICSHWHTNTDPTAGLLFGTGLLNSHGVRTDLVQEVHSFSEPELKLIKAML